MMFELVYSQTFSKQIKKFPRDLQKRILATLERIRVRPYSYVKKLVGDPYFRLRVGDYRIILDIHKNQLRIFVIEVDHRKNIYK